jgi:TRAP-type uncharacterized transport system substrate-binding protein
MSWRRPKRLPIGGVALFLMTVIIALAFKGVNFGAKLNHVDLNFASGSPGGNYSAIVDRLAARAAKRGGEIINVSTQGSVENIRRLAQGCDIHFALVQDGIPLPDADKLELIGRLPRSETVFIIGRDAARLTKLVDLRGMRIGIGPPSSGTDHLARSFLESDDVKPLGLKISNHSLDEQLVLVSSGGLDLAVFVMDETAQLMRTAIRERGLQLVSLENLEVIPTRVPFVSVGTIRAGQYDMLAVIPPKDHPVLRVDTLLLGNRCGSRSEEIGLLSVLTEELPGFMAANTRDHGGALRRSLVAKEFYANEGPGFADQYIPWLVDIMPLGNWFYIAMSVSVLFNLMTLVHKVRLWRIDSNRDKAFHIVLVALGETLTPAEIMTLEPTDEHRKHRERIDAALKDLDALRAKTRIQENSFLVPLGAEWMYRYEEEQMESFLSALRVFRAKLT